ncbi:hypothetical protein BpHYR1_019819 [Brachionus plicatilis]|uniref:Uncharacterized protein n=1 Tax=Brachionus plicatilis TaxID=10195 RepID=A0A3M7R498_BRAPC|nr:hypothetical protein BpHYR1_019819 [Brachionus plicatilis]
MFCLTPSSFFIYLPDSGHAIGFESLHRALFPVNWISSEAVGTSDAIFELLGNVNFEDFRSSFV